MDPNHFHYQQAMFNYMSNYQNPNPQNSQFPSVPTNPAIFFSGNTDWVYVRMSSSTSFYSSCGTSENDIMVAAHAFFAQDEGTTFNLEYVWRLLKDEPKWMGESIGNSSKITKSSASGASSDNPNTPSSYEFNSSSPMERPMGQKAAKRKGKAKEIPNAMQDARIKRAASMERLAQCKEDELELKAMNIIMKDTSTMNDNQRDIHEKYCNKMKKKYGM
ncbi:unnamed protein product [Vicia faba]|uniref:No apical meristem-associated C-terminal domain-containing protein n=1 Tax=Vicia faba TaxID=3906 RepID=A0AAV1AY07_VICFA|nr:unnamed protein product [Vicia faba]